MARHVGQPFRRIPRVPERAETARTGTSPPGPLAEADSRLDVAAGAPSGRRGCRGGGSVWRVDRCRKQFPPPGAIPRRVARRTRWRRPGFLFCAEGAGGRRARPRKRCRGGEVLLLVAGAWLV